MKASRHLITSLFLAGGIALAAAPVLHAEPAGQQSMGSLMQQDGGKKCPMDHRGGKHHGGQHHGMMGGHDLQPRFLRGLDLTDVQRDKVFEILYPLMPEQRAQHKQMRDLHQQQRDLVLSDGFDAGKLKKLLDAQAKAQGEFRVKMATAHNKIYQLLTAGQKAKLAERQQQHKH